MNKTLIMILALLLTACAVQPQTEAQRSTSTQGDILRVYDNDGDFAGHIDERSRRIYDRDGNFVGMIR